LQQYRGTPYAAELARIFRKLAEALPDEVTIDLEHLAATHSFRTTAVAAIPPRLFTDLVCAIRRRRRLRIRYWSAWRDEETVREIDPYHLAAVDGDWYVIAGCLRHGDVRIFNPIRIRALEMTDVCFEPPADFSLDAYLADSFGIFRGADGERHRVRLLFTGEAARYVAERTWHPTQITEPTPDGGLLLTFELSHLQEIMRFALSWGRDCTVLEPEELRARVAREIAESSDRYLHPANELCKHPLNVDGSSQPRHHPG
jgi:proteasome accessory factor B